MNTLTVKRLALLVLGFSEDAAPIEDDILKAYRKISLLCHPDTGGNDKTFRALTLLKEFLLIELQPCVAVSKEPERSWDRPTWNPPPQEPEPDKQYKYYDSHESYTSRKEAQRKKQESQDIPW